MLEFSDEEKEIIDRIGEEHLDYVLCALFNHRNEESANLNEEKNEILIENTRVTIKDPNAMLEKYTETDDPIEAIRAGLSLLECSVSFINQISD